MGASVRAAALVHFGEVGRQVGLDPQLLLREAGLDQRVLTDPDLRVPAEKVAAVLESAAERSGVMNFGARMAALRQLSDFGALSLLISHQPTLRAVLATMTQYRRLLNEALALHVEESADIVILREELTLDRATPTQQAHELAVGTLLRLLRSLLGQNWLPLGVYFSHAPPADPGVHRRLFGPHIVFGSDFNGIVCASPDLDRPNPAADPGLARYARQFVNTLPLSAHQSITQDVRRAIYLLLPLGRATIVGVAETLGFQVRSLQRRLTEEGSEFQALLASIRRDLAVRYLSAPRYSLTEIAVLLGYAQLSSFSRWFAGEFGDSPKNWRKASEGMPALRRR